MGSTPNHSNNGGQFPPQTQSQVFSGASSHVTNDPNQMFNRGLSTQDLQTKVILLRGTVRDGLYMFPNSKSRSCSYNNKSVADALMAITSSNSSSIRHHRLGHPSTAVLSQVLQHCNIPFSNSSLSDFYDSCKLGKHHSLPYGRSVSHATAPSALIHTDVCGHSPVKSREGFTYYIHFIDIFSDLLGYIQ
ncbi:hypothetical protein Sjap_023617 [Stephania japonica]|uniref:GAG-pre-integrase domain-containing protein n=1 Tax=Stephania japonica TaxID=461633 RepID=A0AAP0EE18_9MAGN